MTTLNLVDGNIPTQFTHRFMSKLRSIESRVIDSMFSGISVIAYLFLYVPIFALVVFSFDKSPLSSSWTGFTWSWYSTLTHDSFLLGALKVSLIISVTSALLSTILALMSAIVLNRLNFHGKRAFMAMLFLPLLIPEIVLGVAIITMMSKAGLSLGYGSLIAGHIVLTLPYGTLLLLGASSRLDPSLEEAATDLGCNVFSAFLRVVFPLLLPAIFASLLLSFTISFTDVVMSNFTSGVGTTTLPVYVYGLLKTGVSPEINALGTLLVVGTLVIVGLIGMRQLVSIMAGQMGSGAEEPVDFVELEAAAK